MLHFHFPFIVTRANTKPAGVRLEARRRPQQQVRPAAAAAAHQGGGGGPSRPPEHLQQLGILAQQCPGMRPAASARLPHPVLKMLPGCRLGLALVAGEEEGGQPGAASPPHWAPGQLLPGSTGGSGGGDVLCFASDGAVVSVSVRSRTAPTSTSLLGLQSALQRLPVGDLALLTGVLQSQGTRRQEGVGDVAPPSGTGGSSSRHATHWQLSMGAGGSGEFLDNVGGISGAAAVAAGGPGVFPPHLAAASRPQMGAATLPGNSVDGALLRLLAGLPREVRQRLVAHLEP